MIFEKEPYRSICFKAFLFTLSWKMKTINLKEISTTPPENLDKKECIQKAKEWQEEIEQRRHIMMAQKKHSLLVILQGMDAAGKDSAIRKVFSQVAPFGIKVQSFKKPTDEEMAHDFLWRVHKHAPEKGMIQVFNRSHYEDVLIQRVHQWIDEDTVFNRFKHINQFEELLEANHTKIIKFYLHISKEDQLKELTERIETPEKYYKHNPNDFKEREKWDDYMKCYEDVFKNCSEHASWHIIPSDKKWYKEYLMSEIILNELNKLDLSYPLKPNGE